MNRLCQSSYGNLEAVINISSYDGNAQRQLVHFYRDRMTGRWSACAVVSGNPKSGGSMIQSTSRHHANQEHGDFEVVVLEADGALHHYTRDNTIPVDNGIYAWRLSAIITDAPKNNIFSDPGINEPAIHAAPLFQSHLSMDNDSDGTTLETVAINENRKAYHYRCSQYGIGKNLAERQHRWKNCGFIADMATGPAYIYQTSSDSLMALIPVDNGIKRYCFKSRRGWEHPWEAVDVVTTMSGPSCVYTNLIAGATTFHALVRVGYEIHEKIYQDGSWKASKSALTTSLGLIGHTPYHKVLPTNPIAVLSQPNNTLGQFHNTDAIVFHACGTGLQDAWMILHWSLIVGTGRWVVCGVVLQHVIGMPL